MDAAEVTLVPAEEEGAAAFRAQAELLRAGALDGLLLMAESGHPLIVALLLFVWRYLANGKSRGKTRPGNK